MKDVARVELAALDYSSNSYLDHDPAVALAIFQRPGSNALETAQGVSRLMVELSKRFPPGIKYAIVYNPTQFIQESVNAVVETIGEAIVLVVLVVIVFLQTWRAAIIPLVAIPVSLIGTFFFMSAFGFTLNNLSLFGLVLAIGIVVDDAIVVVENVERNISEGLAPREAAIKSMNEVGSALIAIALVLCAVFVPSVFITGISGQFYRQFALTIAGATVISLIVSLTLSPAMCALLLKPHDPHAPRPLVGAADPCLLPRLQLGFRRRRCRNFLAGHAHRAPRRDHVRDLSRLARLRPQSNSARRRSASSRRSTAATSSSWCSFPRAHRWRAPMRCSSARSISRLTFPASPTPSTSSASPGRPSPTRPIPARSSWCSTRSRSAPTIRSNRHGPSRRSCNRRMSKVQDAFIIAVLPPPVRGIGTAGGFRMMVEDRAGRGSAALQQAAVAMMVRASQTPGVAQVFTLFETSTPQVYLDIDRTKAQLLGINVQDVFNALQVFLGSAYVNDFNLFGRTFRVTAQARDEDRINTADVLKIRVRNSNGDTVPLGSFTTVRDISGPYRVPRYNLFPAAELDGAAAPGFSQGQAIAIMEKLAAETLPDGFTTEWTTLAFQQIRAGNTAMFAFVLAVVFVFLVLAAQYESLTLPLAVILIVPMCLVAAITGVILRGQDNNILTQVGFVVLIGLAAKNAILIVEFARQLEDQGRSRWEAAVEATRLRLRPILMTSFAFIFGVTPLVWAIGAGAELRQTLGTAVFAGMIGVTAFGLVFTPVFYVIARWIAQLGPRRGKKRLAEVQPAE